MSAGRRTVGGAVLVATVLAAAVGVVAVVRWRTTNDGAEVGVGTRPPEVMATTEGPEGPSGPLSGEPEPTAPTAGADALVDVAVATLWDEPAAARALDQPSMAHPVDAGRWLSDMTVADRLWLVDRLVTQALYGDRVRVLETSGDWARVVVAGQPSSLHPDGYPGWLPLAQLTGAAPAAAGPSAVVTTPLADLRAVDDPDRAVMELSYATALPVVAMDGRWVTVARPDGTSGLLARTDVVVSDGTPGPVTGADLVDDARLFSGLPYLWAGTSALGFDCSGLMWAVYRAHGVVIPRDTADQAAAGRPVEPSELEPGDLLFYGVGPERSAIHHVAMYVGDGEMIQSPATGRTVETVPVDTVPFDGPEGGGQFWGARRYL